MLDVTDQGIDTNLESDHAFVEKWCYGFKRLKAHVRGYDPNWAESISGVPALQIE